MLDASTTSIITAVIAALGGGAVAAILTYFLNRKKTVAEIQKLQAETQKINVEVRNLSTTVDSLSDAAEQIIFDGRVGVDGFSFKGAEAQHWTGRGENARAISPIGRGTLKFEEGKILNIQRTNTDGRYELYLLRYLYQGREYPTLPKNELISGSRRIRINCEAKSVNSQHTLRFILRTKDGQRLAESAVQVNENVWGIFEVYLTCDPTQECQFRIDDENVSAAPSSVQIRNLVVAERQV